MLLAPHRLQRPNETQLNQHKTQRRRSNRRAIAEDTPGGNSALGKGIRLPVVRSRQGCLPLPSPVLSSSSWKGGQAQEGPPSKPIEPQPAAARQPTPRPGCVQGSALKRIQSGEEDVDLRSGCRSSSSLIKPGRNRSTCSGGVSPLLRGGTGQLSRGLCRLCWTLPFNSELCAARCLQSGCLPLHWDALESRGGKG